MRFSADGVSFPDELLWEQSEGRVVFVCGAGVSQHCAELPDFMNLTKQVLDRLGTQPENPARKLFEAANEIADNHGITDLATSDRIFGDLLSDFDQEQINREVAAALKPAKDVSLKAHETMLRLAKRTDGTTRLITTNFDRLFEKAGKSLNCVTRSKLPNIEFEDINWGIIHLHGVLEPDYSGPTSDGLILSSADFGSAYLAAGWAREFIQRVLNKYTVVFVGYSANDPPIRYLLEGMKISGLANQKAYAFQVGADDRAISQWDDKGVEAIVVDNDDGNGFNRLWDSLEAWSKRSQDEKRWRERVLKKARKGPRALAPFERGMVAHIVSSSEGARALAFCEKPVPAEWLCVFDPSIRYGEPKSMGSVMDDGPKIDPFDVYRLDSDLEPTVFAKNSQSKARFDKRAWNGLLPTITDLQEIDEKNVAHLTGYYARTVPSLPTRLRHLAYWITKVAHQPAAPWWAGRQGGLHNEVLDFVGLAERPHREKMPEPVIAAWRAITEVNRQIVPERRQTYELKMSVKRGEHSERLVREYVRLFEPYLVFRNWYRRPLPPSNVSEARKQGIVSVSVEYDDGIKTIEIPNEYVRSLIPKIRRSLLQAIDLEQAYGLTSTKLCSIEQDEPQKDGGTSSHDRSYKFSGHALIFVSLFKRLAAMDSKAARNELELWPKDSRPFKRLRVWATGNLDIFSAADFMDELASLSRDHFWPFDGQRDLMLGLKKHWDSFSLEQKRALTKRIKLGPTKRNYLSDAENLSMQSYQKLNRIHWLAEQGCEMLFDIDVYTEELKPHCPDWSTESVQNAARTHDGRSGSVRTDKDTALIEGLTAEEIIPAILKMDTRPNGLFVHFEPFAGLAETDVQLALQALDFSIVEGQFRGGFWRSFLYSEAREDDAAEIRNEIASKLALLETSALSAIEHSASRWFQQNVTSLTMLAFTELWQAFMKMLKHETDAGKSTLVRQDETPDWDTEAINSTSGHLTELQIELLPKREYSAKEGFKKDWKIRCEELIALPGDQRCFALNVFGTRLDWMYYVDPEWVHSTFVSILLDKNASKADQDALWSGFLLSRSVGHDALLRVLLPRVIELPQKFAATRRRHTQSLAATFIAAWAYRKDENGDALLSSDKLKRIILDSDAEMRSQMIWLVEQWSKKDTEAETSPQDIALPFLREVWPKQKKIRTAEMSARLCELALSRTDDFPDFVEAVIPLISRVEDDRIFLPELRKEGKTLVEDYPEAMLALLYAVLGANPYRWPYSAESVLNRIGELHPRLRSATQYAELISRLG